MDITKIKNRDSETKSELQNWIDEEVPQIIDEELQDHQPELTDEQVKYIEEKITKMLGDYFK